MQMALSKALFPPLIAAVCCALGAKYAVAEPAVAEPSSPQLVSDSESATPASFLPVWRLLSQEQKHQFVAGYLKGWQDAATVTDIAISYIRQNPSAALEGMMKIRAVYDLSELKPEVVVETLDRFYANPDNRNASLSVAITAARNK